MMISVIKYLQKQCCIIYKILILQNNRQNHEQTVIHQKQY